jgi:hypothetical protein
MNRDTDLHVGLKKVLGKLYALRDSCWGVMIYRRYPSDFAWFEAAAGICQEANDQIKEAGDHLKKNG